MGAGGDPKLGKKYAEESIETIKTELFGDNTHMVFITAGMGGGTGTRAAPVIANIAKSMGILTVGIVTIPFLFELRPKITEALKGVHELSKNVDALLVINNERLFGIYIDNDISTEEAFKRTDDILTTAARSIAEVITNCGTVNRDFSDVETAMKNGGKSIVSTGIAKGERRVENAIKNALHSPLLQDNDVRRAKKMLCILYSSSEHPISIKEMSQMDTFIDSLSNKNIKFIWGLYKDESLGENAKVTIIATGLDEPIVNAEDEENDIDELINQYYGNTLGKPSPANNVTPAPEEQEADGNHESSDGHEDPCKTPIQDTVATEGNRPSDTAFPARTLLSRIREWINHFLED